MLGFNIHSYFAHRKFERKVKELEKTYDEYRESMIKQYIPKQPHEPIDMITHFNCGVCQCSHLTKIEAQNCEHFGMYKKHS
jgi:hypothetical protein